MGVEWLPRLGAEGTTYRICARAFDSFSEARRCWVIEVRAAPRLQGTYVLLSQLCRHGLSRERNRELVFWIRGGCGHALLAGAFNSDLSGFKGHEWFRDAAGGCIVAAAPEAQARGSALGYRVGGHRVLVWYREDSFFFCATRLHE